MPAWWGVGELVCVGPPRTIHSFPRSEDYLIFTVPRSYVWEISLLTYSSGTEKRTKHAQEENPPSGTKAEARWAYVGRLAFALCMQGTLLSLRGVPEGHAGMNQATPRVCRQGYHASIYFGYILVPVEYFDASPILILGEWDVPRYSRHRITKGIHEYYSYPSGTSFSQLPQNIGISVRSSNEKYMDGLLRNSRGSTSFPFPTKCSRSLSKKCT